jgi:PhnB protein
MANIKRSQRTTFAPHLQIRNVLAAMEFYKDAFDAIELRRVTNPDGSVHVAEMSIDGALFHIHEEVAHKRQISPETAEAVTCLIGLFIADPDTMIRNAVAAGGRITSPLQDYDYGYRQGVVTDPFGHQWLIQSVIS